MLAATREEYLQRQGKDLRLAQYAASAEAGMALAGKKFMNVFDLKTEPDSLRETFAGEFHSAQMDTPRKTGILFVCMGSRRLQE